MRYSTISLFAAALSASISHAAPTAPTEFYLVTTDQSEQSSNSSTLKGVSATTPFAEDPISYSKLLLRQIESGYNSLPKFSLSNSALTVAITPPRSAKPTMFSSSAVQGGVELQFVPINSLASDVAGNVALQDGYLVTVGGEKDGWTICTSDTGYSVLWWKGTGSDCKKTYLQAVGVAPYKKRNALEE